MFVINNSVSNAAHFGFLQKNVVHRDLGVRNVFVGEESVLKLGDFGLARVIPIGETTWRMKNPAKLPIRYISPEAFEQKTFSQASDVWAFGITMWEIMTYADTPYDVDGIEISQLRAHVLAGGRPKRPDVCTLVELMIWAHSSCTVRIRNRR